MGIMDFIKKGKEAPAPEQKKAEPPKAQVPPQLPAQEKKEPSVQNEIYTVKQGDSLSKIAKRFYGKANLWNKIYEANKDQIKNPDLIQVGQKLVIPKE
jgi:nucleoid-associated protein YgaU